MTEEMRNSIADILEKTIEPISGLSISDLCVVKGIKFDALSEKFSVYLDLRRMALITSTFFYVVGEVHLEEILSKALKQTYPSYAIRYVYVGRNIGKNYELRVN